MTEDEKARKAATLSPEAHAALRELARLIAQEKGVRRLPLQDAADTAIFEALSRRAVEIVKNSKPASKRS